MVQSPRRSLLFRLGAGASLLALLGCLTACYEHVVRAKGPGAKAVDVYEPNLKEEHERIPVVDDVEDAIFGPKDPKKKTAR